jgi:uncharacterized protein YtpQ (UPF0354 family)
MSEEPLLPCLKEPAWAGRDSVVARPLWRESSPYVPWVALGYDRSQTFEFLNKDQLPQGRSPGELESEAIHNLRQREASWQDLELDLGGFRRLKMLVATDDFTAERILDPAFLLEAQGALDASGLLVAVPRRGFLAVTALDTNVERVHTFGAVAATQFQGGESAPITPALFTVRNGQITGAVDVVARAVVPPEQMAPTR